MEAVILCGVQGSGKTTLYRDRFLDTHARISMDLLKTRSMPTCLANAWAVAWLSPVSMAT